MNFISIIVYNCILRYKTVKFRCSAFLMHLILICRYNKSNCFSKLYRSHIVHVTTNITLCLYGLEFRRFFIRVAFWPGGLLTHCLCTGRLNTGWLFSGWLWSEGRFPGGFLLWRLICRCFCRVSDFLDPYWDKVCLWKITACLSIYLSQNIRM